MADRDPGEPSAEKRERILQALAQARDSQESRAAGRDGAAERESAAGRKPKEGGGRRLWASGDGDSKPFRRVVSDCLRVNSAALESKLIYFMMSAGSAGAAPLLSVYGSRWGLAPWHLGLAVGAGLLAASVAVPLWAFAADKLRWHRGMFWAVVLAWMGLTFAAVYGPRSPDLAPCDVARSQLLAALRLSCSSDSLDAGEAPPAGFDRESSFGYPGRYPIALQTWPQPCTVDAYEVCALAHNASEVVEPHDPPTNSSEEPPGLGRAPLNATGTDGPPEPVQLPLEASLGWPYEAGSLYRASLALFVLSAAGGSAMISAFSLADVGALMCLGEAQRDRYGWQRCFGTLGFAPLSLVTAVVLYASRDVQVYCGISWQQTDYFFGLVLFAGFMTVGVLVASCLVFKHNDMSSQHTFGHVAGAVFSRKYSTVFVTAFVLSFCNGALGTFLLWHLRTLGATPLLLGAAISMFAVADIVTSFCTAWIVKKSGYHFPLVIGIVGYCLMHLGYALIVRPGWAVVLEIIHGASYAITINTMTSLLASSVALVSQASVQGLLSGVYWGLGPAAGVALYGYLVDVVGATLSFYTLTLVCVVYGLVFLIWNRHELPLFDKYMPGEYQPVDQTD